MNSGKTAYKNNFNTEKLLLYTGNRKAYDFEIPNCNET